MGLGGKVACIVVNLCRIGVGGAMIYSGVELLRGKGLLSNSGYDSTLTALFVIGLGLYCIFQGGPAQLFEFMQQKRKNSLNGK